jgi:hypothetical protein
MSKQLYDEALADVRKVKELAEANAQRAILDVVTPRIRELIESQLMGEEEKEDSDLDDELDGKELLTDELASAKDSEESEKEQPGGMASLLDDAPGVDVEPETDDEYELTSSSAEKLAPLARAPRVEALVRNAQYEVDRLSGDVAAGRIRFVEANKQIERLVAHVEDTYEQVQALKIVRESKGALEKRLESCFSALNELQESMKMKKPVKEAKTITLELTGLPDDLDLDGIGANLVSDEEGEEGDVAVEPSPDAEGDEGGEELDFDVTPDEAPEGGAAGEDEEEPEKFESKRLGDDVIVEIDERMLAREVARMRTRRINEEAKPGIVKPAKTGDAKKGVKDFGGGKKCGAEGICEEDDEGEEELVGEAEEGLDELQNRRKGEEQGTDVADGHSSMKEGIRRRMKAVRHAAMEAARSGDTRKQSFLRERYNRLRDRLLGQTNRSPMNEGRPRQAENVALQDLRSRLADTNLVNARLTYANKVLQTEGLSQRQKSQVVKRLEASKTIREAKAVYARAMEVAAEDGGNRVNESNERRVLGSSSRVERQGSAPMTECSDIERWGKLAGLTK